MSDNTTIARPYAKAIFQVASGTRQLVEWSKILHTLAQTILDPLVMRFVCNPASTVEQQSQLLLSVFSSLDLKSTMPLVANLTSMLATNKRLLLLPDIFVQFEMLRAEQEKTLTVEVSSYFPLSSEQQQQLVTRLSKRLQRQVTLDVSIDKSLLGGAVIRAGDLVIDDSVLAKLIKLGTSLAA